MADAEHEALWQADEEASTDPAPIKTTIEATRRPLSSLAAGLSRKHTAKSQGGTLTPKSTKHIERGKGALKLSDLARKMKDVKDGGPGYDPKEITEGTTPRFQRNVEDRHSSGASMLRGLGQFKKKR